MNRTSCMAVTLLLALSTGCVNTIERFTIDKIVRQSLTQRDLAKACSMGEALTHPLTAATPDRNPPNRALVMSELTSGMCYELLAREAELLVVRSRTNLRNDPIGKAAEIKDARALTDRLNTEAALRFERAWTHLEAHYGTLGTDVCPRVKEKDEVVLLMGIVGGVQALLRDKASGGTIGIPLDRINAAGRAASCLDNERWWHAPQAIQAASWATVPGTAPDDIDPWALLEESAKKGDSTGVRFARALQVRIAVNSGRNEIAAAGIKAHAQTLKETPTPEEWNLLDEYSRLVSLHESDLLWTAAHGHRTLDFGELPGDEEAAAVVDPFAADPFAADPFATNEP
jgi:hypothetical protein